MDALLAEMTAEQLTEWRAFDATTAATVANVNRQKGHKPYSPLDFMPAEDAPRETKSRDVFGTLKRIFGK